MKKRISRKICLNIKEKIWDMVSMNIIRNTNLNIDRKISWKVYLKVDVMVLRKVFDKVWVKD